jgi:hypothetical protein
MDERENPMKLKKKVIYLQKLPEQFLKRELKI